MFFELLSIAHAGHTKFLSLGNFFSRNTCLGAIDRFGPFRGLKSGANFCGQGEVDLTYSPKLIGT